MIFKETPLSGAYIIDLEKRGDDRGFFARMFCKKEFSDIGLEHEFVQVNNSLSTKSGVLRGMHFQLPPHAEVKVVRCVKGALWDFIVDLRPDSVSFKKWFGAELSAENRRMMYVPRGFGHGFITLSDNTEAVYLVSDYYSPEQERGVRFDDRSINVELPITVTEISSKDASWPDLSFDFHGLDLFRDLK
jgi:dTDP-4-dehydrorhamnose 3,5-epimerase